MVFTAHAMGKEIHSHVEWEELERLTPQQNSGNSAHKISRVARERHAGKSLRTVPTSSLPSLPTLDLRKLLEGVRSPQA